MTDCIFCKIANGEAKSWKVYEDQDVCAFFDYNPASAYHTLVIPKKHYTDFLNTSSDILQKLIVATQKIALMYQEKLGIENFQIINSCGAEGQQEVFHIHLHIVPRKKGDNQDIKWINHVALREQFDQLVVDLNRD